MGLVFDAATRKSVSKQMIALPLQNNAIDSMLDSINEEKAVNDNIDGGNDVFYENYAGLVSNNEIERSLKDGVLAGTFVEADIENAIDRADPNLFYPVAPATPNPDYVPFICPEVNGGNATTAASYEYNAGPPAKGVLLCNEATSSPAGNGIENLSTVIQTGFAHAGAATTLTGNYLVGNTTITTVAALTLGQYVLVAGSGHSMLCVVLSVVGGFTYNIYVVCESTGTIVAGGAVSHSWTGFTEPERTSLTATVPTYQDLMGALTTVGLNSLVERVNTWEVVIAAQRVQLVANDDPNHTVEVTAEIASIDVLKIALDNWLALVGGAKFSNVNLASLSLLSSNRRAANPARIAETITALGGVTRTGVNTYAPTGVVDDLYYQRYVYLDVRINMVFGSLRKSRNANKGTANLTYTKGNNTFLESEYAGALATSKISANADGSVRIALEDATQFLIADNVYVLSESVAEIAATIQNKSGNVLTLNVSIPGTMTVRDLTRVVKEL